MISYIATKSYEYQIFIEANSEDEAKRIAEHTGQSDWECVDESFIEVFEVED